LIGLARVFIGAHYVTDVLGGWILGGLCGAAMAWLLLHWPTFRERSVPSPSELPAKAAQRAGNQFPT
jgi:undecaprenyl-diphosphatase